MYRLYDWECCACGDVHAELVWTTGGTVPMQLEQLVCPGCGRPCWHTRLVSIPAKLLSDRPLNPMVRGGSFDTAGFQAAPELPDHPLGNDASARDWRDHWQSPQWREAKAEVDEVGKRNRQKRKRAAAIARGENINMRVDRCAGDPKVAS